MLKFIDEATPDDERFNAVKALFFRSAEQATSDEDKIISYQFMKIAKELDGSSLLILKAAYDICNERYAPKVSPGAKDIKSAIPWLTIISQQVGHRIISLVELYEDKLVDLKLISPRVHPDRSGIERTKYFRLTDFGYKFCEFIYNKSE